MPRDVAGFCAERDSLVWNARKPARSPDAIVTVASVQDVRRCVRFAYERGLKVAVRGSGHNYFGAPVRSEGLLLNLARLQAIQIHARTRRVRLQPAVKSGQLISALLPWKLAFPVGHSPDVGLGGFLLNGGMGWNMGQWGPACANVSGIEVVLASGELVYASAEEHSDLFWAARGAGPGFFGVITGYDVAVYPLPAAITVEVIAFDVSSLDVVGPWLDSMIALAPADVEITMTLGAAQDPLLPVDSPALSVTAVAFADRPEAHAWVSALYERPPPGAKVIARKRCEKMAFRDLQHEGIDADHAPRMTGDAFWSNSTITRLMSAVRPLVSLLPSAHSYVLMQPMKGISAPADAAFSILGSTYIAAYSFWNEAVHDRHCDHWIAAARAALEPLSTGYYVGEADLSAGAGRVARCFPAAAWQELTALKRRYDPQNTFFWYDGA